MSSSGLSRGSFFSRDAGLADRKQDPRVKPEDDTCDGVRSLPCHSGRSEAKTRNPGAAGTGARSPWVPNNASGVSGMTPVLSSPERGRSHAYACCNTHRPGGGPFSPERPVPHPSSTAQATANAAPPPFGGGGHRLDSTESRFSWKTTSPAISTLKPQTPWWIRPHPSPPTHAHAIVLASWREGGPKSTEASDVRASVAWPAACGGYGSAPSSKPITTAGGRIRPPCGCEAKRTPSALPPGVEPEGPGLSRQGPDTLHRSLAMELRPLGLPPWCVDQQLQPPHREGTADRGAWKRASPQQCGTGLPQGADLRAPLPRLGGETTASQAVCAPA